MLALRLARGTHPIVLLRRLMVAAASAGVGFLLLCTLGHALGHPEAAGGSAARLLWCLVPLAAAMQLAVAVARTDPATRPQPGLSSVGLGPVGLALLAAASTAVSAAVGSALALFSFLYLRGDLGGEPFGGSVADVLGAGQPLPYAGVLTLLFVVPALTGAAVAVALRPRKPRPDNAKSPDPQKPVAAAGQPSAAHTTVSTGLPWGVALTAAGIALGTYASRTASSPSDGLLPLPGRLDTIPAGVVGGWVLIAIGLVLACPGLTHLCGRLLASGRPGALRLLAGRVLQEEAVRLGRPLGVLCAVASAALAASQLYGTALDSTGARLFGPLTGVGAAVVMACATATVLTVALETKGARIDTTAALGRIGVSSGLLRKAAALRAGVLVAVLAPMSWAVAELASLPLSR
ncbi:hypothetical protein AB0C51_16320 [Streptomyces pathocidini]|uniref:Integral membrane protein n=1 Tax=Streptomyces pathocidini TaxID=1650571 RepID=A0ABW7UPL9_9ACTN|nr:hypothetical protein [Streptomyces pathocidini]